MKRYFASLIAFVAICLMVPGILMAQTTSGEIRGRVVDAADAAVVGADVTLTNELTGEHLTATTNSSGEFIFVGLQPGLFSVSAKAPGFKQYDKRDLRLSASERLSAGTLKLQVGAVTQTMTVTAEATPLQTESSERSALLDSKEISTLMTPGRDVLALTRLLPGVVKDGEGSSTLGTSGPGTISGVRESSNAVTMDGVTGNVRGDGNKFDTPLNMDAVGEVKILLNNYQAEYGQSAGGIINLTTKSGTQTFHGSAYYYGRNEAFNANSWLNNFKGQPRGLYRFNTVGYNVGGPVYIPGHFNTNKDKLFFFFSQEIWPTKTNSGFQQFMMPTAAERNGDFSQTYDAKGQKVTLKDPNNCGPAGNGKCLLDSSHINPAFINPNTQKLMNIFPLPTINCTPFGGGGVAACPLTNVTSGNAYNYSIFAPRSEPTNQQVLRVDYNISNKWHTYFHGMNMFKENRGLTATTNKLNWGIPSFYQTPGRNAGFNVTFMATPTLVNEFTIGYADWKEIQNFANASDLAKVSKSKLGVSLGQNNPNQNPTDLVPRITGLSSGGSNGTFQLANAPTIDFDNRWPMKNATGTWEGTDGLTKIWGHHTSKAGAYFQAGRYLQRHIGSVFNGNFNFGTSSSNPYDTNYAYSNMLLGSYNSYQEGSNVVDYAPHWNILEWYVQDNWKVLPNLSLDYGIRFTYDMPTELAPGFGAGFVSGRYDPNQVPALYRPVLFSTLSTAAQQAACKPTPTSKPSRCAQNPSNPNDVKSDSFIGTFVSPFTYTGTVVNTDPTYPHSLRKSNGVLYAPRFGLAWDPFGKANTVIRMGAGLYYNTREGGGTVGDYSLIAPLVTNNTLTSGQITSSTFVPNCGTTNTCFGNGLVNANPQDTRILEPNRKIESTFSTNFGLQRKFGFDTVMDIGYVGTFGRHLNQQINLNTLPYLAQQDPKFIDPTQLTSPNKFYFGPHHGGVTLTQNKLLSDNYFRPYMGYANVNVRDYGATSNYHALQTSINRRFTKGLQFGVSYTWSKTMTTQDTVNGAVATYQDRRFWNYGEADFDRTHIFVGHWVWSVPKASNLWNNKFMRAIGDNWEYSGIAEFVSGHPLPISMSGNPNLTFGGDGAHVLLIGDPYAPKDQIHKTLQYINPAAFALPQVGVIPSPSTPFITRANVLRGPGTNNFDMALQKNIPITERLRFSLRAEAYNVFNHPSFTISNSGAPVTADFDTTSSCTGAAANDPVCGSGLIKSNSVFGQINGERGARVMQLSGRITF